MRAAAATSHGSLAVGVQIDEVRVDVSAGLEAVLGHQPCNPAVCIHQVEQKEGHVEVGLREHLRAQRQGLFSRLGSARTGQVAQCSAASLREHLRGHFRDRMEQATNAAGFVGNRTEREREPGFFEEAVAVEEHPHFFEIGALPDQALAYASPITGNADAQHSRKS